MKNPIGGPNRKLAHALRLRSGETIETMGQAAEIITERVPRRRRELPIWTTTAKLLLAASKSRSKLIMEETTLQLARALQFEGWLA